MRVSVGHLILIRRMEYITNLKSAKTIHDVGALLGFQAKAISYLLYVKPPEARYVTFEVAKSSGGKRLIAAPIPELKNLQGRLGEYLQHCLKEIELKQNKGDNGNTPDRICHGFKKDRSILTNARHHRGRRFVFNIDLEDFFGSITFPRVRGFFMKDRNFLLDSKVATILAQIACFPGGLPQGSPCSPVISNLIGHILDIHLVKLAKQSNCTYTRYADDLTFSTNERVFPSAIAAPSIDSPTNWCAGPELKRLISASKFKINESKTRMQYRSSRQIVTGLVVNKKVNIRAEYRRTARAMIHRLITTGSFDFIKRKTDATGKLVVEKIPGRPTQLHGMLSFIDCVDRATGPANHREAIGERDASGKELMYRRFLMYKEFYASHAPVLLCEGPTDSIYLTNAIWRLAGEYPALMAAGKEGKQRIGVRRFTYTDTNRGRILGIDGGADQLRKFILDYRDSLSLFKASTSKFPAIVLIDNDSGAKGIFGICKDLAKYKTPSNEPFMHVCGNLYVVPTPLLGNATQSCIEDLFKEDALNEEIDGKTFTKANDFDTNKHYGKMIFANKIVKAKSAELDFSGFKPLLEAISSAIAHNENRIKAVDT